MELNNMEVKVVEIAAKEANDNQIVQLNELQLAFVGGGIADVVFG
jgi:hypothetical protein